MGNQNSLPLALDTTSTIKQECKTVYTSDKRSSSQKKVITKLSYLQPIQIEDQQIVLGQNALDSEKAVQFNTENNQQEPVLQEQKFRKQKKRLQSNYKSLHMGIDQESIIDRDIEDLKKKVNWNSFAKIKFEPCTNSYKFGSLIGKGGFGKVFQATHIYTGRKFAAKQMKKEEKSQRKIQKCLSEMQIMSKLDHPNIVKLIQAYDSEDYVIIVEYINGWNLEQYQKTRIISQPQLLIIAKQILRAICYLHQNDIIHRDIKCENIIKMKEHSIIKLIDFGTAINSKDYQQLKSRVGTLPYMAPQVIDQNYGKKCDIWSLGITLYRIVTDQFPSRGSNRFEVMQSIKTSQPTFNDPLWTQYSLQCRKFIKKLLTKNPNQRPSALQCLKTTWINQQKTQHNLEQENLMFQQMLNFKFKNNLQAVTNTYIASQLLRQNDKKENRTAFTKLDTNQDGMISQSEIQAHLHSMINGETTIEKIMEILDLNKSGKIDYTQFIIGTMKSHKIKTKQNLLSAFHYFDIDHNGLITIQQFTQFLEEKVQSKEEIKNLFDMVDKNKDGKITKQEFLDLLLSQKEQDKINILPNKTKLAKGILANKLHERIKKAQTQRKIQANSQKRVRLQKIQKTQTQQSQQ